MQIINQKGSSLLYVIFVIGMLSAISFGISSILISQIRMLGEVGYSVVAFYAADSGIERILMERALPDNILETILPNGAAYQVFVTARGVSGCAAPNFCIRSIGTYRGVRRAIEITY